MYRAEDRRGDDRDRDRSPLRSEKQCESDTKKQKLTFGFGKKASGEQKKGIQIKIGSTSVSKEFYRIIHLFIIIIHFFLYNFSMI